MWTSLHCGHKLVASSSVTEHNYMLLRICVCVFACVRARVLPPRVCQRVLRARVCVGVCARAHVRGCARVCASVRECARVRASVRANASALKWSQELV